ncbi:cell division protein FtsB [Parashewanella curva]|uniref:Cell division protein FtsB n=1 Tax=Parashewanella curva TaxID=2338552 RepID=A0A3L8Q1J4_9GAMM|nr:cell division protein FtsB [Parashewanella curva]RLV61547.1 cell division protein FtsB [Parashewanella curva]
MKLFIAGLLVLLTLLQYRLWWGVNGLHEYFSLLDQIHNQQQDNQKLVERNQVLKEEIANLQTGTEALEERARNELGLVKEGETFYRVVRGKK